MHERRRTNRVLAHGRSEARKRTRIDFVILRHDPAKGAGIVRFSAVRRLPFIHPGWFAVAAWWCNQVGSNRGQRSHGPRLGGSSFFREERSLSFFSNDRSHSHSSSWAFFVFVLVTSYWSHLKSMSRGGIRIVARSVVGV